MLSHRRFRSGLAAIVLTLAACRSTTGSIANGPVGILANASQLRVHNTLSVPVFYFVYDRASIAAAEWSQCANVDTCRGVMPGATVTIPATSIGGYRAGQTTGAVFYWWVAVPSPSDGPPTAGPVHGVVIELQ